MVGGVTIRLQQDEVFQVCVLKGHLATEQIANHRFPMQRHAKPNDKRRSLLEIGSNLLWGQVAAVTVVAGRFLARLLLFPHALQALRRAEAAIGVSSFE
jgi:hypothetical protein